MNSTVYLETSIIGYLASRPSRELITAANQQLTRDWWDQYRQQYELYISETVVAECSAGAPQAAQERLAVLTGIPVLDVTEEADNLADEEEIGVRSLLVSREKFSERSGANSTYKIAGPRHIAC